MMVVNYWQCHRNLWRNTTKKSNMASMCKRQTELAIKLNILISALNKIVQNIYNNYTSNYNTQYISPKKKKKD